MGYQIGTINFQLFRVAVRWPQNSYLEIIQTKHNHKIILPLNIIIMWWIQFWVNYAGVPFWPRKVFEGVHCHVIDLLRKYDLGSLNFSSKFKITCPNTILVHFSIVRNSEFGPISIRSKIPRIILLNTQKISRPHQNFENYWNFFI